MGRKVEDWNAGKRDVSGTLNVSAALSLSKRQCKALANQETP